MKSDSLHAAVAEILPWVANGTANLEEQRMAEEHVATCAGCTKELAFLRRFEAKAKEIQANLPATEDRFARTLNAIEEWESSKPRGVFRQISSFVESLWIPSPLPMRAIVVAQLVLILALGGFLLWSQQPGGLVTLSGGSGTDAGVRLDVAFQPGVTEETMRQVFLETGSNIVSGPSSLGIYVLALPLTVEDPEATINQLRSKTGIIRFVERQP